MTRPLLACKHLGHKHMVKTNNGRC